ncbi:MAG: hypothetical protein O3C43_19755 [Verrucomicrobia bacterium]|nr:hypothetical protein [Verrucomicrobiota bacterium]MDA1068728.1 hypothetical protein [Verrucomicrobiota bacterium]
MGWLSIRTSHLLDSASRGDLRKQIRNAAKGDVQAFQTVSDHYLNFVTEYLVVSGYHEQDRIRKYTRKVFHNLWLGIAYMRRVSDIERQLYIYLKQIPINVAPFQDFLIQRLTSLNALQRFLVVGRDLESWNSKNLTLATRIPKYELKNPIYDAWKVLAAFKANDINFATNACMESVIENMDCPSPQSDQRRLSKKIKENPIASAFKAECLSLRCELVELRQNARWDDGLKSEFFTELTEDIAVIKPLKPVLSERLINQFSFQQVPH